MASGDMRRPIDSGSGLSRTQTGGLIAPIGAPIVREQAAAAAARETLMPQTNNPFLDELARLMTDAAGAAQGMRREFETLIKAQAERMLQAMDVVQREEFEAVKEMAAKAREENEALAARIAALEAQIAAGKRS
jgi:BMFP domain-containing protein YqiC